MQLEMPLRLLLLFYFTQAALAAQSAAPWTLESTGPWAPREGLMVAKLKEKLYLTGGRGPEIISRFKYSYDIEFRVPVRLP